ncbi:7991_t:CDS:2, partial [Dentiscutata heterogama]
FHEVDRSEAKKYSAYKSLLKRDIIPFKNVFLEYFALKPLRSIRSANEDILHTAFELLLPSKHHRSELCLVVDPKKERGDGRYGFIDIFLDGTNDKQPINVILELKYISLTGLLSGAKGRWIKNPTYEELKSLDLKLKEESVDQLLKRKYMHWSEEKRHFVVVGIGDIINEGTMQVRKYFNVVLEGRANRYKPGISDDRSLVLAGL